MTLFFIVGAFSFPLIATFELRMRHNFVALNGHVSICCFLGMSLVPNYIFSDEIENLYGIYAVAGFNSRLQLQNLTAYFTVLETESNFCFMLCKDSEKLF